jgi:hypothetical protein
MLLINTPAPPLAKNAIATFPRLPDYTKSFFLIIRNAFTSTIANCIVGTALGDPVELAAASAVLAA